MKKAKKIVNKQFDHLLNTEWFFNKQNYLQEHEVSFKQWFYINRKEIYGWKAILFKIIILFLCCVILIPISLHLQNWAMNLTYTQALLASNSSIKVIPILNSGIEFSALSKSPCQLVYFVESITVIVTSFLICFLPFKIQNMVTLCFCLIGGCLNIACRVAYHTYLPGSVLYGQANHNVVIDYWHFTNTNSIFNFNDTLVISGAIGFGVSFFGYTLYKLFKK